MLKSISFIKPFKMVSSRRRQYHKLSKHPTILVPRSKLKIGDIIVLQETIYYKLSTTTERIYAKTRSYGDSCNVFVANEVNEDLKIIPGGKQQDIARDFLIEMGDENYEILSEKAIEEILSEKAREDSMKDVPLNYSYHS
jgi:hypothetical protein